MFFKYICTAIVCIFFIIISSCGIMSTNTGAVNSKKSGFLSIFSSGYNSSNAKKDSVFSSIGGVLNKKNIFYQTDTVQKLDELFFATLAVPDPVLEESTNPDETKSSIIKSESDLYSNISIVDKELKKETEQLYKEYVKDLRYRNNDSSSAIYANSKLLPATKKALDVLFNQNFNQPRILYVIYSNLKGLKKEDVKEQIYLSSYLNLIKSYSYSKKINNLFIQEVQFDDLPLNTILAVLKPITAQQFKKLPKQVNVYNANRMSYKTWLEANKVNNTK